jgi:hypothetical protein
MCLERRLARHYRLVTQQRNRATRPSRGCLNRKDRKERKEKLSLCLTKKPFAFFAFFAVNSRLQKAQRPRSREAPGA